MLRNSPNNPQNPYPDGWTEISDFQYETGLMVLRLKDAPGERDGEDADYVVGADYRVSLKVDGQPWSIEVPRGMITDLTSVPIGFRWLVGRVGPHLEAAIVHDYLYIAWEALEGRGARYWDQRFADEVMLLAMGKARVSLWRRTLIYMAISMFGWLTYHRRCNGRYVDLDASEVVSQFPNGVSGQGKARRA